MSATARHDVIVVGGGLAGLVTTVELAARGARVLLLEQEGPQSLGGQAHWSLGGLLMVDTPLQRERGIADSFETARRDWIDTARYDATGDERGRAWAEAYLAFASGEMFDWLTGHGVAFVPVVANPERAIPGRTGGNSVPRTHVPWGMGPGLLAPFVAAATRYREAGLVDLRFRHRVDGLLVEGARVTGVHGTILADDDVARGGRSSSAATGDFRVEAPHVVVASGGIGGALDTVRAHWPVERLGPAPATILRGVPEHVDGRMIHAAAADAGGDLVHLDRTWTYAEGLANHAPRWAAHGIRILPGPSSLWLDASGRRFDGLVPGSDAAEGLARVRATGADHSWFVLTQRIAETELTLGGADQNPGLVDPEAAAAQPPGINPGVAAFLERGEDVAVAETLDDLIARMRAIEPGTVLDADAVRAAVAEHDDAIADPATTDPQVLTVREANAVATLITAAPPHALLDPTAGPLIAMRLRTITRKTLGGLRTDLDGRVLTADDDPIPRLSAVGEASGFGGGGSHGYRALEGGFLGQCLHTGLRVAQALTR